MKHRLISLFCLLCVCALLAGCQSQGQVASVQVTLPPVAIKRDAPTADADMAYEQTVMMYLPSLNGTRLVAVPQRVLLPAGEHMARVLCEALLAHFAVPASRQFIKALSALLVAPSTLEVYDATLLDKP